MTQARDSGDTRSACMNKLREIVCGERSFQKKGGGDAGSGPTPPSGAVATGGSDAHTLSFQKRGLGRGPTPPSGASQKDYIDRLLVTL